MSTRQNPSSTPQTSPETRTAPRNGILAAAMLWSGVILFAGSLFLCGALYQDNKKANRNFQDSQRILAKMNQKVVELAIQTMKYEKQLKISRPQSIASAYTP